MYGPGQSMPQQPVPPAGYGPGAPPPPPPGAGRPVPGQQGTYAPQPPAAQQPPPGAAEAQPRRVRRAPRDQSTTGTVLTVVAAVILIATGVVNAASGPLGYRSDANVGVLIMGGDPLLLAAVQTACGVLWVACGVLLLLRRRIGWGGGMAMALVFATYESYFIVRGSPIHFVGLFLAIAVVAVLYQDPVRRRCQVAPPAG